MVHTTTIRNYTTIQYRGWFLNKLKTGEWFYYLTDGSLVKSKTFVLDKEVSMKLYHRNGRIKKEVSIMDGNYHGLCKYYNEEGELYSEGNYDKGLLLGFMKHYSTNDSIRQVKLKKFYKDTTKFSQELPSFLGGEDAMMQFIIDNIDYPEGAKDKGIQGVVKIKFTVNADGTVRDVSLMNKEMLGYGCEREAIEIVENMPNWSPGILNGKPVMVYYNLPVRFKLF